MKKPMTEPETLRLSIIQERLLERSVARETELRRRNPSVWQAQEASRIAANRDLEPINERLQALGLRPLACEPSLAQKRQELQRLKKKNLVESAAFRAERSESQPKSRGTRSAHRRS